MALFLLSVGNTQNWTWIGGDLGSEASRDQLAVGGTKGVAASSNYPGGRQNAIGWSDNDGYLWLFGGVGYVGTANNSKSSGT